jgi:hypothetical protein
MISLFHMLGQFFKVITNGQSYLNLFYLLAAFPLGVFYFIFLVTGFSIGITLSIIWVGIPLLLVVGFGWWTLARFERFLAVYWLKEKIPSMMAASRPNQNIWMYFKGFFTNPVFWKSPIYLFLKFPLGITTFVILITLLAVTLAFLTSPLIYELLDFQIGGFFFQDRTIWQVDSLGDALFCTLIGLLLWPLTMQIANGLTWVHAKFAGLLLNAGNRGTIG